MSVPPLITLPSSACIASVVMSIRRVVGMTESPFTLEQQVFKWPGEQWSMEFVMPPILHRITASDWIAFGVSLEGKWGRFLMGDPSAKQPRGVATGTPLVDGGSQTGNTLATKGWTAGVTGILLKGDYIQLGSGTSSRLHMVTANANSDGSGNASLAIAPALRASPADNDAIVVNEAKGLFRLNGNDFSWSVDPGPKYRFSFSASEVL